MLSINTIIINIIIIIIVILSCDDVTAVKMELKKIKRSLAGQAPSKTQRRGFLQGEMPTTYLSAVDEFTVDIQRKPTEFRSCRSYTFFFLNKQPKTFSLFNQMFCEVMTGERQVDPSS